MSVQRDILARLTDELPRRFGPCGVLVAGSVQRGEERKESDLDVFVVFPDDGPLGPARETSHEGIRIDLSLFPENTFLEKVEREWFYFWMFSRAEIVHDPTGIARRNQDIAMSYFSRHPQIDRAWEKQLDEVKKHKADPTYLLKYPTWESFSRHMESMVRFR